jgi:hypothetical protein
VRVGGDEMRCPVPPPPTFTTAAIKKVYLQSTCILLLGLSPKTQATSTTSHPPLTLTSLPSAVLITMSSTSPQHQSKMSSFFQSSSSSSPSSSSSAAASTKPAPTEDDEDSDSDSENRFQLSCDVVRSRINAYIATIESTLSAFLVTIGNVNNKQLRPLHEAQRQDQWFG